MGRAFHRVRQISFASGATGAGVAAIAWDWSGGWAVGGLMALAFIHSIGVVRHPVPVEREILLDAIIIGLAVWVIGLEGLGFLLVYPLAVALLFGHSNLVWRVVGVSAVTNAAIYLDDLFPSWTTAQTISHPFGKIPQELADATFITWAALYAVASALLFYLWRISEHARDLERSQSLLLRGAAHDIRNAVSVVSGLAEILDERSNDEDDRALIGAIVESAEEAMTICRDLLTIAHHFNDEADGPRRFDLVELVTNITTAYPSIEVHTPKEATVYSDPQRIGQIVRNLVANAIRHGGPRVVVSVTPGPPDTLVRVSDNGDGVPGDPSQVFRRRASTHAAGLGVGLAGSADLAQRIGAELTYRRASDWTVFSLAIPIETPEPASPEGALPDPERTRA